MDWRSAKCKVQSAKCKVQSAKCKGRRAKGERVISLPFAERLFASLNRLSGNFVPLIRQIFSIALVDLAHWLLCPEKHLASRGVWGLVFAVCRVRTGSLEKENHFRSGVELGNGQ